MAFKKEIRMDKIEVIGGFKKIGIKEATVVSEGSDDTGWVELSRSFNRKVLTPDSDVSGESTEVQDVCNLVWTDAIKASWASYVENLDN